MPSHCPQHQLPLSLSQDAAAAAAAAEHRNDRPGVQDSRLSGPSVPRSIQQSIAARDGRRRDPWTDGGGGRAAAMAVM